MRILPLPGHSFCAKLILSSELLQHLGSPEAAKGIGENLQAAWRLPQVNKSAGDNGLRMQGGFPYNSNVSRNKEILG
jgi:hypothetical protein